MGKSQLISGTNILGNVVRVIVVWSIYLGVFDSQVTENAIALTYFKVSVVSTFTLATSDQLGRTACWNPKLPAQ